VKRTENDCARDKEGDPRMMLNGRNTRHVRDRTLGRKCWRERRRETAKTKNSISRRGLDTGIVYIQSKNQKTTSQNRI
jgi:hypothetical protein